MPQVRLRFQMTHFRYWAITLGLKCQGTGNALHSASVVSKGKRILAKDLPQSVTFVSVPALGQR